MRTVLLFSILCAGLAHAQTKWEYASIGECNFKAGGGPGEGSCRVYYATPEGWKPEVVSVNVLPTGPNTVQGRELAEQAIAKAMAKLGKDGWELVSVVWSPDELRYRAWMYFKRPVPSK